MTASIPKPLKPQSSVWPRRSALFGLAWGLVTLFGFALPDLTPENLTYLVAISSCGLYSLVLYFSRRWWIPPLFNHPKRNAILVGIFNAAVVEIIFLVCQKLFGAQGIAVHPNLLVDWLLTMPWYIGMVVLFVGVQWRAQFSIWTVLLLGGLYELGADGVVGGQVMPLIFGNRVDFAQTWFFLSFLAFWQFIIAYSSMVLPPTWLIKAAAPPLTDERPRPWSALKSLLWLFPYMVYMLAAQLVLSI